ncbi:MAG TPA: hypothetical protein VMG10_34685 [Gemmataceae bacterium]|nr:hypothetical protein [Gemmataceae bacterium]
MRSMQRNAILAATTAVVLGLFIAVPREDAAGRALAPAPRRPVLTGTIKLKGDPPDLDALNKRHLEEMKKKDTEYCLQCDEAEKSQQTFRLGGRDNRQVGNVFVWIVPDTGSFFRISAKQLEEAKKREVILRQPHCAFIPHCIFLFSQYHPDPRRPKELKPTGQVFKIVNDAKVLHVPRWFRRRTTLGNVVVPEGTSRIVDNLLPDAAPLTIHCNIHSWMSAYLRVVDTPYYAISLSDTLDGKDKVAKDSPKFGTYEIKNPPAGKVRITAWHEKSGYLNKDGGKGEVIDLKAGGTTRKDFELTAR